ncbi:AAA family ATPase [Texcoconibacillus texcoconensis]|uniref:Nitric oxide reductase NorQ protein n=1 Tax=Texcoconibacillus texcoconensis TaxID=1095777 RepID=A0A840QIH2_9BACI|nr:MoxR family ATPase [Texcoconibacillus texcoconensis]MBB5171899.1 nitric oxide reductase NorQ protein [Texcoconibacillus texcoconensis]
MKKISEWMNLNKDVTPEVPTDLVPSINDFIIDKKTLKIIQDFMFTNVHLAITGNPGTGKTELAKKLAASFELPYVLINVGTIRTPGDWWGFMEYKEGEGTYFHKTRLTRALESEEPHVVILNEFNRCPPHCHNPIYDILDGNRSVYLETIDKKLDVHPDTIFLATLNRGMTHTGTFQADAAIEDRFEFVHLQLPSEKDIADMLKRWFGIQNKDAVIIARLTKQLENLYEQDKLSKVFGMRPAISAAKLLTRKNSLHDALVFTFANRFSREGGVESEHTYVLQLIQALTGGEHFE